MNGPAKLLVATVGGMLLWIAAFYPLIRLGMVQ